MRTQTTTIDDYWAEPPTAMRTQGNERFDDDVGILSESLKGMRDTVFLYNQM